LIVQGDLNLLFRAGLRKDFLDEILDYEPEYQDYLKTGTMSGPEIAATIMVGMPRLYELGDGEPIPYDDPKMGPKVMAVDKEFGLGFMLTRKTVEDDLYNKANQSAKWLGHALKMTQEVRSAQLLDDAFAGSTFKGIDGKSLCNTAHTLINSTATVANAAATPVGLSIAGITALMNLAQQCKDENGDPHKVWPNKLLIGNSASQYNKALQIFGTEKEPFTADNTDNAVKKRMPKAQIVMSHYMTSTTAYFLIDDKQNDCHFLVRRAPLFEDGTDFNTKAALYSVSARWLIWFVGWRGWFGANPS